MNDTEKWHNCGVNAFEDIVQFSVSLDYITITSLLTLAVVFQQNDLQIYHDGFGFSKTDLICQTFEILLKQRKLEANTTGHYKSKQLNVWTLSVFVFGKNSQFGQVEVQRLCRCSPKM